MREGGEIEAEQVGRPQDVETEGAVGDDRRGMGDGRKQERIEDDENPADGATNGTARRALAPDQPADGDRCDLRDAGEG